jgi:hypothetical protein
MRQKREKYSKPFLTVQLHLGGSQILLPSRPLEGSIYFHYLNEFLRNGLRVAIPDGSQEKEQFMPNQTAGLRASDQISTIPKF